MISVIIPTYNRSTVLRESIMSILNQTYHNIELIVVDDGSTDDTRRVVESIKDNRMRYIYQENAGACAARNNGIRHAKGEFIAFHDSDDVCRPNRIEKQLSILLREKVDVVCTRTCGHLGNKTFIEPKTPAMLITEKSSLLGIATNSFFGKTKVFRDNLFDVEMPRWQDLEILIRIFSKYQLYLADDVLVDVFVQEDSISRNPQNCIRAFELMIKKHPEIEKEKEEIYYYLLKLCARSKAEIDRRDCIYDFKVLYKKRRDFASLVWYIAARLGLAGKLFSVFY